MATQRPREDRASLHLTFGQIADELAEAEEILLKHVDSRRKFDLLGFATFFPKEPGVYCVFLGDELVYVGESGDLQARMKDLRQTRNHTFRRSYGKHLFGTRPGFVPATSSKCFESELEVELNQHMGRDISVSFMEVHFGRREIEEHIIATYRPAFCVKGRRGEKL